MSYRHSEAGLKKLRANSARYAEACKSGVARENRRLYGETVPYCPSPEEIEAGCREVQARWSRADRLERRQPWVPPGCEEPTAPDIARAEAEDLGREQIYDGDLCERLA